MSSRAKELVSELTTDEKMKLLTGQNFWETVPVDRLGMPSIRVSDGPHGLRKVVRGSSSLEAVTVPSLCFPTSAAMAATWNRDLVEEGARALGEITAAEEVDVLLGPGVNIKRTPLCGRNFEYYSEDPYLAGELAVRYITGVQSAGVGTSLKHFVANNQEFDRFQISAEIDERALREIYFPAFEKAVKEAHPWTVMCAYNRINGVYASENRYTLEKVLREQWGFAGIVVSDWWAVHDRSRSLKASLELEMPYSEAGFPNLQDGLKNGLITEAEIDAATGRLLDFVFKAAESRSSRNMSPDTSEHRRILTDAARESMTLLKNQDGILPLSLDGTQRILVLGGPAETPVIEGGGSSEVTYEEADSPLEILREITGTGASLEYQQLYRHRRGMVQVDGLNRAMTAARTADVVVLFAADQVYAETEDRDRESMRLPASMERMILSVAEANPSLVVVLQAGSAVDMSPWIERVGAVLFTWFAGQGAGTAMAEVLAGVTNPSGKTAESFPYAIEDTPAFPTYPGDGFVAPYTEGLFVGYRYYDTLDTDVLFPFGHGLSYTSFEYSELEVTPASGESPFPVRVSCTVRNTGSREGKETVQLYVRDTESRVERPVQELKGFEKVDLKSGARTTVTMELDERAFSYWSTVMEGWHWESGAFEIRVGASSRDVRLSGIIELENPRDLS